MAKKNTIPMRTVRVEDDLWVNFMKRCASRSRTGSQVIRGALHLYMSNDENAGVLEQAADELDTTPGRGQRRRPGIETP